MRLAGEGASGRSVADVLAALMEDPVRAGTQRGLGVVAVLAGLCVWTPVPSRGSVLAEEAPGRPEWVGVLAEGQGRLGRVQ